MKTGHNVAPLKSLVACLSLTAVLKASHVKKTIWNNSNLVVCTRQKASVHSCWCYLNGKVTHSNSSRESAIGDRNDKINIKICTVYERVVCHGLSGNECVLA